MGMKWLKIAKVGGLPPHRGVLALLARHKGPRLSRRVPCGSARTEPKYSPENLKSKQQQRTAYRGGMWALNPFELARR